MKVINAELLGRKVDWKVSNLMTGEEANVKINKSNAFGIYSTIIQHFQPSNISGKQVCPEASEACKKLCINITGRGGMFKGGENGLQESDIYKRPLHIARAGRTAMFFNHRKEYFEKLIKEINNFIKRTEKRETKPAIRLNGTSDIQWELIKDPTSGKTIFELYPDVQFYDYTKIFKRLKRDLPSNYDLTFSRTENNDVQAFEALELGFNVAVVFRDKELPETFNGFRVVNGDVTDMRFKDNEYFENNTGKGIVVGLYAKGRKAKFDESGFVVNGGV